jgi:acyl-CoA reductase-like NAD-dependent aldehyde dehydrogenase
MGHCSKVLDVVDPATGKVVGSVPDMDASKAIQAFEI